jgi:hypothetical protein
MIIELPIADVAAGTVYNAVSVVAAGLDCPNTLYVVGIIILPLIRMVI